MDGRTVGIDGMNKTPCGVVGDHTNFQATVIPTIPPRDLQEFSTTSIFNTPEDLPKPLEPLGPFVTSSSIKLTEGEKKLLSKDPKYSLVFPPSKMKLSIEIERMNTKIRYNNSPRKMINKQVGYKEGELRERNRITDRGGEPIEWNRSSRKSKCLGKKSKKKAGIDKCSTEYIADLTKLLGDGDLAELFSECKDRYVHNPVDNCIDFTTRRATDYKLNRNVHLPKPMSSEKELQCELRRSTFIKAFEAYQSEINNKKIERKEIKNKRVKRKNCVVKEGGKKRIIKEQKK